MKTLMINGIEEKIPPYPHPKNFVYRSVDFLKCHSVFKFLRISNFQMTKEAISGFFHRCMIPREILIDPTNACNMNCLGCWAGEYEDASKISFERWDKLIKEARALGTKDILYTGGEPLMRKKELLFLAKKYNKLFFGIFTNSTLVDEAFVEEMEKSGNIMLFLSIEGYQEETDFRRGKGAYQNIMRAMKLLKSRNIAFGFSLCYHKKNYQLLSSDTYLDFLREQGAWMGWAFGYRPIGSNADMSLTLSAEERLIVSERFREYSDKNSFLLIDLFNSGHRSCGCVGGGDGYIHINANGDVEPCAFCHYSNVNIHDMSLHEALKSPFMRTFRRYKRFTDNPFAPCPVYDNPETIVKICQETGAVSTHPDSPESAEDNARKLSDISAEWHELTSKNNLWKTPKEEKYHTKFVRCKNFLHRLFGDG